MGSGDWKRRHEPGWPGGRGESVWSAFSSITSWSNSYRLAPIWRRGPIRPLQLNIVAVFESHSRRGLGRQWVSSRVFRRRHAAGTAAADECRIGAIVQAWAVLSGAAPPDRAAAAVARSRSPFVDEKGGIIRLLDPPFDVMPQDPGYIRDTTGVRPYHPYS